MRNQISIHEMSDRELRSLRRVLRLRRERRYRILKLAVTAIATLCIILAFATTYGAIKSNANSKFKYYTSVTVEAGESLWDIADEYIDYDIYTSKNYYISEVKSINHLNEEGTIVEGQMLIVPYYSAEFVY